MLSSQVKKMISSNYQFCRAHLGLCKSNCILCASTMLSPRIKCLQSGGSQSCFVANVQAERKLVCSFALLLALLSQEQKNACFQLGHDCRREMQGLRRESYMRGMFQAAGTADEVKLMNDEVTHESVSLHKG